MQHKYTYYTGLTFTNDSFTIPIKWPHQAATYSLRVGWGLHNMMIKSDKRVS